MQTLGAGVQGTATLVRCVNSGRLVVRKRTEYVELDLKPFADQFVLPHPNIMQLLDYYNYRDRNPRLECWSSATYWQFANAGMMYDLLGQYADQQLQVPELLIWKAASQLLSAYGTLHGAGIAHGDGHLANVLLHWDGLSVLPEVILGDLGMCDKFGERIHVHRGPTFSNERDFLKAFKGAHVWNQQWDLELGPISLDDLLFFDLEDDVGKPYFYPDALLQIGEDMDHLACTVGSMMFDDDLSADCKYSLDLDRVSCLLYNLQSYLRSPHVRTMERWNYLYTQLRCTVERGLANCIDRTASPQRGLISTGPKPIEGRPVLFETADELLDSSNRPPGPWSIAAVDPDTFEIVSVQLDVTHCLDEWKCNTNAPTSSNAGSCGMEMSSDDDSEE